MPFLNEIDGDGHSLWGGVIDRHAHAVLAGSGAPYGRSHGHERPLSQPIAIVAREAHGEAYPFPEPAYASVAHPFSHDRRQPSGQRVTGQVAHVAEIARDVVEVVIRPHGFMSILPGQYCQFQFAGHAPRPFSPTGSLGRIAEDGMLRLNVRRGRDGGVTSCLGRAIRPGHDVEIEGPYGEAVFHPHRGERLVLVGSGTGFAPIWAVAAAALRENPYRDIVLIAASRRLDSFYMAPALTLASCYPGVVIVAVVEELTQAWRGLIPGRPLEHVPMLGPADIVYGAGAPELMRDLQDFAATAGAAFYGDAFETAEPARARWIDTAKVWLKAG